MRLQRNKSLTKTGRKESNGNGSCDEKENTFDKAWWKTAKAWFWGETEKIRVGLM